MKQILYIVSLAAMAVVLAACGEKKKSETIIAPRVVKVVPKEPIRMQPYMDEKEVSWIGKTYFVTVSRQPSDSLPMVKDETGQKFVDNLFQMTVTRTDGSVFFDRKFTKNSFNKYINEDYRNTGILEGIVFDQVDGDWLVFAASVAHPQTDEYIPLVIKLSRMGVLEISQDTQMDTDNPRKDIEENTDDEDGV